MNKPLDEEAITRAARESAKLATNGTPEQRAGMFRPRPTPQPQSKRAAGR
jgi:hypothetical protein